MDSFKNAKLNKRTRAYIATSPAMAMIVIMAIYLLIILSATDIFAAGAASALSDKESKEAVDNGLPVVYLEIDESKGSNTIAQMNASPDHSVRCKGNMAISVPKTEGGFRYSDAPDTVIEDMDAVPMEIRGRGNTTWQQPKKPYKIKLGKKASVLGMGENKHWVLIANYLDETLIRDRMTGWLGREIGMVYTPIGYPVDVVMNGKYLGSYWLAEQLRVGKNRIEIDELTADDNDYPSITGGYLIQGGMQTDEASPSHYFTERGLDLANHTPSFDPGDADDNGYYGTEQQKEYIRGYIRNLENAIFSADYRDASGRRYSEYMDLSSAAKYWLVMQASLNGDAYVTGSTYLYKERDRGGAAGKLYWGPLWDFDGAWVGETENFDWRHDWLIAMMCDPQFASQIKKEWPAVREALYEMSKDGGLIDKYYAETAASKAADDKLWKKSRVHDYDGTGETPAASYEESISRTKAFIRERSAWLDKNLGSLDTAVCRQTWIVDGRPERYTYTPRTYQIQPYTPEKDGYIFTGWRKADGTVMSENGDIAEGDAAYTAEFVREEDATRANRIYFSMSSIGTKPGDEGVYNSYTVLPADAQDKRIDWSSSDPEIVSVNEIGGYTVHRTGTVTITATLRSGASASYTIIVKNKLPAAKSIKISPKSLVMKPGMQLHIGAAVEPAGADAEAMFYEGSDDSVAKADDSGVVTAFKEGTTSIEISNMIYDHMTGEELQSLSAKCRVTVVSPEQYDAMKKGVKYSFGFGTVEITSRNNRTVSLVKAARSAGRLTVPAAVSIAGLSFSVTGIEPKAFRGSRVKTLVLRTKKLTKSRVRASLRRSGVRTVKLSLGSKKLNNKYIKKYKKIFTGKNAGRRVRVK